GTYAVSSPSEPTLVIIMLPNGSLGTPLALVGHHHLEEDADALAQVDAVPAQHRVRVGHLLERHRGHLGHHVAHRQPAAGARAKVGEVRIASSMFTSMV